MISKSSRDRAGQQPKEFYVCSYSAGGHCPLKDWPQSYFEEHNCVGMVCSISQEQFYALFGSISWARNPSSFQPVTAAHGGGATEPNSWFEGELWGTAIPQSQSVHELLFHFLPSHLGN